MRIAICDDEPIHRDIIQTEISNFFGSSSSVVIDSFSISKAQDCDIRITDNIILEKDLKIDSFDLASLLANALENAIEGIKRSDGVERKITLYIDSKPDVISIVIENNTTGPVLSNFQTTKKDKKSHGFGLPQMKAIVNKYNGDIHPKYDPETGKFTLSILLRKE